MDQLLEYLAKKSDSRETTPKKSMTSFNSAYWKELLSSIAGIPSENARQYASTFAEEAITPTYLLTKSDEVIKSLLQVKAGHIDYIREKLETSNSTDTMSNDWIYESSAPSAKDERKFLEESSKRLLSEMSPRELEEVTDSLLTHSFHKSYGALLSGMPYP